jgi:DNA processing protein
MMSRAELAAWLRLGLMPGIGLRTAHHLLVRFGLPDQIFSQSPAALAPLLTSAQQQALLQLPPDLPTLLEATHQWLDAAPEGVMRHIVSLADGDYPTSLLTLPDPPLLLYITGSADRYTQLASKPLANDIAIVGSRRATPQGTANARGFASAFAQSGMHIVSGMALGIDAAAHEGALEAQASFGAGCGSTIAVVGTGLDRVYPKQHRDLAHRIAQHGLILSEFPIGTPPLAENFPRRNRIIAALTQGTLVVEAAIQSGSLITARQALDMGKEVFAIPGSIHSPQSKGCHHLIKQGAKLVESAQDVLEELPIALTQASALIQPQITTAHAANTAPATALGTTPDNHETQNATKIVASYSINTGANATFDSSNSLLQALGHDPVSLDTLIDRTGINAATLQAQLLELELLGQVARLPGALFQRQMSA